LTRIGGAGSMEGGAYARSSRKPIDSLIDEGLANATVNRHLATLRSMFNPAFRWRVFDGRNPAAAPGELREVARDRYLSAEETRALVAALDRSPCQGAAAALALLIVTGGEEERGPPGDLGPG
jgi:hypothetical protein